MPSPGIVPLSGVVSVVSESKIDVHEQKYHLVVTITCVVNFTVKIISRLRPTTKL